jgi:DNA-binding NarL/FixJ family response regulator
MKEIFEVLNIFDKLGVHSLPEAIVYAHQKGLVEGNEL